MGVHALRALALTAALAAKACNKKLGGIRHWVISVDERGKKTYGEQVLMPRRRPASWRSHIINRADGPRWKQGQRPRQ